MLGLRTGPGRVVMGPMRRPQDTTQFDAVDLAPDVAYLVRFLETAKQVPGFRQAKDEMLAAMRLRPGMCVLEGGCGLGADAVELAARVAPVGRVVAVDLSRAMIEEARRRAGEEVGITWQVADLLDLPFADGAFDACRVETVLQHVHDPARALAEVARVTRPGGRVVCLEFDLGTAMVDSPRRATTRTILTSLADAFAQGWVGRQLPRLLAEVGLVEISISPRVMLGGYPFWRLLLDRHLAWLQESGVLGRDEIEGWWAELAEAHASGVFTAGASAFLVAATRPASAARR